MPQLLWSPSIASRRNGEVMQGGFLARIASRADRHRSFRHHNQGSAPPQSRNPFHTIFEQHLGEFRDGHVPRHAVTYGMFRLGRFLACGDYRRGAARIRERGPKEPTDESVDGEWR